MQECRMILSTVARDNQSQYEYQMNTERQTIFYPKVHMLTGTLIPVVSTTHLVVHELIGTMPSPSLGHCKNLAKGRVTQ
jgi:hypothetical protein